MRLDPVTHRPHGIAWGNVRRHRFGDQLVDDPETLQVGRGHPHRLRGFPGERRILPQNGGTGFRRRHCVDSVLQHQQPVPQRNRQGATGTAFANHHGHHRHPDADHFQQALGNRRALATLLRGNPRIRA